MIFCMIATGLLEPLIPWMLAPLLDAGSEKNYPFSSVFLPYLFFLLVFFRCALSFGRSYLGGWLDATLQKELRAEMSALLLKLPVTQLQIDSMGKITSRFMAYLPTLTASIMPVCMALVQETIKCVGYVALMLYLQWQLALIVLLVSPLLAFTIRRLGRRMKKAAQKVQNDTAHAQDRLNETVQLWQIIKMQGDSTARLRLLSAFSAMRSTMLRINVILSSGQPLTHFILSLPIALVIYYVLQARIDNVMSAGEVASFMTVMLLIQTPVRNITRAMSTWEQMLAAAREVYTFLDMKTEEDSGKKELKRARGDICFESVSFSYDNATPVLRDFSIKLAAGEIVALVGRSGAGKTTITNLLTRFYTPQAGAIRLDGEDIRDLTLSSLRRQITLITQEPLLFNDSAAMNVAYPDFADSINVERLEKALHSARADDFVNPQNDDNIGDGGKLLSGGQRQRLALARAFYCDSPIVILDEATSALDAETEVKIKESLRLLFRDRTALIISHHFSTIDFADRIGVLDEGRLIAVGTMEELRKTCPLFNELYNAQKLEV